MDQMKESAQKQPAESKSKLTPVLRIFEDSLKDWWTHLKKFVMLYVWGIIFALVPIAVVIVLLVLNYLPALQESYSFKIVSVIGYAVSLIFIIYFSIRAYIGMFLLVKNNYSGQEKEIFKETKKWFWPYIGLTLLTTLFIIGWTILLIIPGIIFSVLYSFAVYVLFFEDKRGSVAIKRSVQLAKNYWWAIFGRTCFLVLVAWIFMMVLSWPLSFTAEGTLFFSIWSAVIQVVNILIGPIALIFTYRIYQDLVKLKK